MVTESKQLHFGFDPDVEYVCRSRVWEYSGVSWGWSFATGEAIAPRMLKEATETQKRNRCHRLRRLLEGHVQERPNYEVYVRGHEPSAQEEPMWQDQDPPDGFLAQMDDYSPPVDQPDRQPVGAEEAGNYDAPKNTGEAPASPRRTKVDPPEEE